MPFGIHPREILRMLASDVGDAASAAVHDAGDRFADAGQLALEALTGAADGGAWLAGGLQDVGARASGMLTDTLHDISAPSG